MLGETASRQTVVRGVLEQSAAAIQACLRLTDDIAGAAERIGGALEAGHKLLACGNGGSAADAQHLVGELMGRLLPVPPDRAPRPAIALTADSAVLTCIANDYGFEEVFARQVRGLAQPGDVLVGISTSGSSANVLRAFEAAGPEVLKVALCGAGGRLADLADLAIRVPLSEAALVQAAHRAIIHALCAVLEARFRAVDAGASPSPAP